VVGDVLLAEARVLLAQGQLNGARDLLARFESAAIEAGRHKSLIHVHLLKARVASAAGCPDAARQSLEQALALAAPEGYRRAFIDEGDVIAGMLLPVRSLAPAFVDSLFEAFARGKKPATALQADGTLPSLLYEPLTDRQLQVLRLVARGLSNREIAETLVVTLGTVKKHLNNVFQKLNVQSRTQAVARARDLSLLP
jgi:LuxR family maltose regulon positive regulatory protein